MKTIRSFIAIAIPPDIARKAARWVAENRVPGSAIQWVPSDHLHLTLKFLGEVENVQTPEVCNVLARVCRDFDPFHLAFLGTDGLPSIDRPRTLTVAVDDPTETLRSMVAQLEDRYADMGFKREPRDYRPHLTLGRARSHFSRGNQEVVEGWKKHQSDTLGEMTVHQVQVIGSFLEKSGPTYNVMHSVAL